MVSACWRPSEAGTLDRYSAGARETNPANRGPAKAPSDNHSWLPPRRTKGTQHMTDKIAVEIFIAMNEDGSWVAATDESDALAKLAEDEGGYHARVVKITVKMAPPKMAEAAVDVPDEAGDTTELAAE
jgi:hypothetical protein